MTPRFSVSSHPDSLKAGHQAWFYTHALRVLAATAALLPAALRAAAAQSAREIPDLRPPRAEIPPEFWEQNTTWLVLGGIGLLLAGGFVFWLSRKRRPAAEVPAEVRAREDLSALAGQQETGPLLMKVTHVTRRYLSSFMRLPPGELTTSEFCQTLATHPEFQPELSGSISVFLRRCDERKFAPAAPAAPLDAARQALSLVEACETFRRERLQATQASSAHGDVPQPEGGQKG